MAAQMDATARWQATDECDLCAALAACGIESLDVSATRAIAIDGRSVLDLEVVEGDLSTARTVDIAVIEHPTAASAGPQSYVTSVVDRLETAAATVQGRADGSPGAP